MQSSSPQEIEAARRIPVWKDFVPLSLRFPLMLLIIVVYMFSGGVYMSAVSQMSGTWSWIDEDVMMAGYASMTGLTMAFPLLFRILFRFPPPGLLLFSAGVFIVSDYLCMVSDFLPLVVFLSFFSGFFKIVATFVCWSNIQLRITPKRDFAVFFPFLFTFVLGSVQLVNVATGYSLYAFDWKAMHRLTIGAFLLVFALVYFGMRKGYRQGPYMPFKGIDYLGGVLWSLWLLCVVFVCVYGEYYDWLDGTDTDRDRLCGGAAVFVPLPCGDDPPSLHKPAHVFPAEHALYLYSVRVYDVDVRHGHYDPEYLYHGGVGFRYPAQCRPELGDCGGIAVGTGIFYLAVVKWKWRTKDVVLTGFFSFFLYQFMLYFLIDPSTEKYMLYLPMVFKGAGVSLVYTSLTYALAGCVTFAYYFEAMCVIGFIRTSFGGALNAAVVTRLFRRVSQENTAGLGGYLDSMYVPPDALQWIYGEFGRQLTMVSLKQVYGYAVLAALFILFAILCSDYRHLIGSTTQRMLRLSQVWRIVRAKMR